MGTTLKNYSTEVPAGRSIDNIESLLIRAGASNIMKEYCAMQVASISFMLTIEGNKVAFRLPAKVQEVFVWLKKQRPKSPDKSLLEQARRVTWKQLHEWVHLQLSMIEIKQLEKVEAFFPYILDVPNNETFYEKIKKDHFKALLPG